MEETIRNKYIKINSTRFVHELETFAWINGKPQSSPGYNDDTIIAFSIAAWVIETALAVNKRDLAYNAVMLSSMFKVDTKMDIKVKGQMGYNPKNNYDPLISDMREIPWIYKG